MSVYAITKAKTFGEKGEWQTSEEFRFAFIKMAVENGFCDIYEEDIDDVVTVLHMMGHVILSD